MSGALVNPAMIPGTDIVASEISASASSYRTTAASIGTAADTVLATWSGLSGVYSAPEAPQLLAAMNPAGTDAHAVSAVIAKVADHLDELSEAVVSPVDRLIELKQKAEEFVASVRGGVTVGYYDPDNTLSQASAMSGSTPAMIRRARVSRL